jgi:hypothetical protein
MRTKLIAVVLLATSTSACVGTGAVPGPENSASLEFARAHAEGGLAGQFIRIDGRDVADKSMAIRVPAGRHTIEYACPDVLTVDARPTVRADFVAGRSYVLECDAQTEGVVRER